MGLGQRFCKFIAAFLKQILWCMWLTVPDCTDWGEISNRDHSRDILFVQILLTFFLFKGLIQSTGATET